MLVLGDGRGTTTKENEVLDRTSDAIGSNEFDWTWVRTNGHDTAKMSLPPSYFPVVGRRTSIVYEVLCTLQFWEGETPKAKAKEACVEGTRRAQAHFLNSALYFLVVAGIIDLKVENK